MRLIFDYLKPYAMTVLAIVILTFAQVQTELLLPDRMSGIVTDGIQYGGITEKVPAVIDGEDLDYILHFADAGDAALIRKAYVETQAGSEIEISGRRYEIKQDVLVLDSDEDIAAIMAEPLAEAYVGQLNHVDVEQEGYEALIEADMQGLEDNHESMIRVYIRQLYDRAGINTDTLQSAYIIRAGMIMLGIAAIGVFVQILSTYLATRTAARTAADMRQDVFEKVESFSSSEFSRFSTSSLITRTGNDITKIQQLIQMMLRMMLMSPIMGITAVIRVMKYPNISWLLIVAIGVIVSAMLVLAVFAVPKFEITQKLVDSINSIMREFLDGILVIRAFNAQKREEDKFTAINSEYRLTDRFVSSLMSIMFPIITFVMNGLTIAITWYGARQIDIDAMSIGEMMAFTQYAMHVVMSFMIVTATFFMVPRSLVSVRRIREVLDTRNTILDPEEPKPLPEGNGPLVFNNVSFTYPGAEEAVLADISFQIDPGETVAIIGSTGAGKSTIVKLIPRLFDVSAGSITYCGIDLRELSQKQLHEKIGLASQQATLFTGTIKDNIDFGRGLSETQLSEAIRISQSENILTEKEGGLEAQITQGGTNVSGGQKQRLSIARALGEEKNIYIFDDCFSALDYQTDKKLRAELNKLIEKTKASVLIVAQRISTIKNADRILVLDEGKIVAEGKHQDLLRDCEVYRQIAYSQLSAEELA